MIPHRNSILTICKFEGIVPCIAARHSAFKCNNSYRKPETCFNNPFLFQEGRTSSPSLSGPPVSSMMTPRSDDMMDTKYRDSLSGVPDSCGPPHHYMDPHRSSLLLPLPTKTEVSRSQYTINLHSVKKGIMFYSFLKKKINAINLTTLKHNKI